MTILSKILEALGIACVMMGLVQGIQSDNMWMELYLSLIGIVLFLIGWGTEKVLRKRGEKRIHQAEGRSPE